VGEREDANERRWVVVAEGSGGKTSNLYKTGAHFRHSSKKERLKEGEGGRSQGWGCRRSASTGNHKGPLFWTFGEGGRKETAKGKKYFWEKRRRLV